LPSGTRGGSRMLELGTSGSVRGVRGDMHPYRDPWICSALFDRMLFVHRLESGHPAFSSGSVAKRLRSADLEHTSRLRHADGAKPVATLANLTANRPPQLIHIKAPLGEAM
jgi:hypothetical protein